ncbi:TIGR02444 family protein [Pseudomonas tructae]|uniref:TIGR02444 family protein n=1 Tax=Pseudomonas tructae TaxID=2518644 RepID=A0A411MBR2_9PSED|nr:TIGR02444 family protein [Pseudomonas tructae]QBF24242.1 TIGR02444 family protein [Pseudomonas tructae]
MHTDLWNFALKLYARPGVEAACLQWQDLGGDVCLLLCGMWLSARGVAPNRQRVRQLTALANAWQAEVVEPLRRLRQSWRDNAARDAQLAGLREQVKGLELAAERILLERLEQACQGWAATPEAELDWISWLAPDGADVHHDALHRLRVVMRTAQDAEDGV